MGLAPNKQPTPMNMEKAEFGALEATAMAHEKVDAAELSNMQHSRKGSLSLLPRAFGTAALAWKGRHFRPRELENRGRGVL